MIRRHRAAVQTRDETGAGWWAALLLAGLGASVGACAPAKPTGGPPPPPVSPPSCVQIVGWNDLHGHLGATRRDVDSGRIPLGGATALADELADLRARGLPTVVLDAGDLFTGPLESTLAEGRPVIDAYRLMEIDAAALGNHEFDFGPVGERVFAKPGLTDDAGAEGPRGALLARMREATFPFLAANVTRADGSPTGWPNHRASVIIERGGFHVGVVGYSTQETPTTTLPPNVAGLSFSLGAAARVATEIRRLRAAGAAPVVLVAHASLEGELPQDLDDPKDPTGKARVGEIAKLLDELGGSLPDLVIAGHRHAWLLGRVRGVPIASSSQHGVGLHVARFCAVTRAGAAAKVELTTLERRVVVAQTPPRTELGRRVAAVVQPYRDRVAALEREAVTQIPAPCVHRSKDPTALGEQVALATLEAAKAAFGAEPGGAKGSWLGLVNAGGVRAGLRAGDVTFGDVFGVFPFENTVAYCATTRAGATRALENLGHAASAADRFPFGLAGGSVVMKRRSDGLLDVTALELAGVGKPSQDDRVFLALTDFLLWGGDDLLKGVTCAKEELSSTRLRDAWRKVLERERRCDGPVKSARVE